MIRKCFFYASASLILAFISCNSSENKTSNASSLAPNFKLTQTNGKDLRLSDFKGKIVILDFWATWCEPCKHGIPDLIDIQKKYHDVIQIIGISVDEDTRSNVIPFVKEFGINYPIVYANSEVINSYGNIYLIPVTFIIDQSGKIVYKHEGLLEKKIYEIKINELLKKEAS